MFTAAFGGIPLDKYHTFGLAVRAQELILPAREEEVPDAAEKAAYILGEGSNILPLGDLPPILSTRYLRGYAVLETTSDWVRVEVAAGENWDGWVRFCITQGWYGVENLAAIPGSVGAAVVQNIGAYGVEIAPFVESVYGWHKRLQAWRRLPAEDCELGYRRSLFQTPAWQDQFVITRVVLRLKRRYEPVLTYPDLARRKHPRLLYDPLYLYETVRAIRAEKLPAEGSAGSFFKNPVLTKDELASVQQKAPDVPVYPLPDGRYKVPAAWLIDRAGLKGYRIGQAQVHPRQPLVLVNLGGATDREVWALAQHVQKTVAESWGIYLDSEVRLLAPLPTLEP